MTTMIQLQEPTLFPDLNKKEQKESGYLRSELTLTPLKYKHFRSVVKYPEGDQMHHLMLALTGLSENDIGELTPFDAAAISGIVFDSMKEYMQLGQKIVRNMNKE